MKTFSLSFSLLALLALGCTSGESADVRAFADAAMSADVMADVARADVARADVDSKDVDLLDVGKMDASVPDVQAADAGVFDVAVADVSSPRGVLPTFSLNDVNATSATFNSAVSPRDYLEKVSGWYFGHST